MPFILPRRKPRAKPAAQAKNGLKPQLSSASVRNRAIRRKPTPAQKAQAEKSKYYGLGRPIGPPPVQHTAHQKYRFAADELPTHMVSMKQVAEVIGAERYVFLETSIGIGRIGELVEQLTTKTIDGAEAIKGHWEQIQQMIWDGKTHAEIVWAIRRKHKG